MKKAIWLLLMCAGVLGQAPPIRGQSPLEQAVAASFPLTKATADRSDLVTTGAVMTLKKDGLVMFATTAPTRASLNYKDGKISPSVQTRMVAFNFMGKPSTNVVQRTYVAGEKLWLIGVQAAGDGVTLQFLSDPVGDVRYASSLKFPFAKGATPTSQQVIAQIGEVIRSDGGGAAPGPPIVAPAPPAEAPIAPPPPPPPPPGTEGDPPSAGWRTVPLNSGQEAMIAGNEVSGVHQSAAVLGVMCSVSPGQKFEKQNQVPSPLSLELRVRQSEITLGSPMYCEPNMNNGNIQIEGRKMDGAPMCNSTKDSGKLWTFQYFPSPALMKQIAASPGKTLTLELGSDRTDEVVAKFLLPADADTVTALITDCLKSVPPAATPSRKH